MTRKIGAVIFEDATRLFLIYDETANAALRPLFLSEKAARDWLRGNTPTPVTPKKAAESEENVKLIMDISLEQDKAYLSHISFASRASRKDLWLTGPRSFMEMIYENGATACREF